MGSLCIMNGFALGWSVFPGSPPLDAYTSSGSSIARLSQHEHGLIGFSTVIT